MWQLERHSHFMQVLHPNPVSFLFEFFTPMQQWWHLPNFKSPSSTIFTESCSLLCAGVIGKDGTGPGRWRQEKPSIRLWMIHAMNLSCPIGCGGFWGWGIFIILKLSLYMIYAFTIIASRKFTNSRTHQRQDFLSIAYDRTIWSCLSTAPMLAL